MLNLQGGRVRTLLGVLHIPALARNLISVSKLDDAGVKTVFEKDTYKMVKGALVLMQGVRIRTLYKLQGSTIVNRCDSSMVPESGAKNLVVFGEKTMLWHQKLGHIGEKGLRILHGKGMVEFMSNSSLDFYFCENCVYGKQNRGYKIWKPLTRKVMYNRDVVFKEVNDVIKHEFQPKEPKKIEFDLKEEESDSTTEEESKDEEPQTPGVRRSVRETRHPERYSPSALCSNFSLSITDDDPRTVKEAIDLEHGKLWKEAMVDEMASLHKNEAWHLVDLPAGRKPIGSKWVFKNKINVKGKVEKYKARFVAKGYFQVPRIDFGDIFSPVAKVTSIRLLLFVVVAFDFQVEQMDVKTTFLHGDLEKEIYMKQPKGFAVKGKKELV
eukprot:PITA_13152